MTAWSVSLVHVLFGDVDPIRLRNEDRNEG